MNEQALLDAWWERPGDETLRVLADAWLEKNEKRGLFVQLSLTKNRTPAQEKKYQSLLRKKGELVGPARPFLREYEFGPKAWCTKRAVKPTSWWRASSTSLG